jgi:AraC family transcriptional regulator
MRFPIILEKPAFTVVGAEASFLSSLSPEANNLKVIGALWDGFLHDSRRIANRVGKEMYGIIYARPATERMHPHELQYIAAVAVTSATKIPDGMVAYTVPAGTFAVFTHRGPIHRIGETMQTIYREWLPQSAYRHAGTADVEVYDQRFHLNDDDSEMDYWMPIIPKAAAQ